MNFKLQYTTLCLPVRKFGVLNLFTVNNVVAHFLTAAIAVFIPVRNKPRSMFLTHLILKK